MIYLLIMMFIYDNYSRWWSHLLVLFLKFPKITWSKKQTRMPQKLKQKLLLFPLCFQLQLKNIFPVKWRFNAERVVLHSVFKFFTNFLNKFFELNEYKFTALKVKIKKSSLHYSLQSYYTEACNEWRGTSPLSAWTMQKRQSGDVPLATVCSI